MARVLNSVCLLFQFEKFVEANKASLSEITPVANSAIEKARVNLEWSQKYTNQLLDYYNTSSSNNTTSSALAVSGYSPIAVLVTYLMFVLFY